MKEWFSANELSGITGMPSSPQGVNKKAQREGFQKQQKIGTQGKAYEYHITSLPAETQQALRLEEARALSAKSFVPEVRPNTALWAEFDNESGAKKAKAEAKCRAVMALKNELQFSPIERALVEVANRFEISEGSLKNWYYKVKAHPESDWLALLLNRSGKSKIKEKAAFTSEAWLYFKGDYLRSNAPSFATCYYRLQLAAKANGWEIPSKNTVLRRLNAEVDTLTQTLMRKGEYAVQSLFPHQVRTVEHLAALEIINGDGYQHNVWVHWNEDDPDAKPIRPKTWYWQDVRTRRILAYVVDDSENADQLRMSLKILLEKFGLPKQLTLDNTVAASNKQLSGYSKNRKRFKQVAGSEIDPATGKPREVKGIFEMLGLKISRTDIICGRGNGQAKPIERCFQELEELIDKHRDFQGYYTGSDPDSQPDDYQYKVGVDKATFLKRVEEGIKAYNARPNRRNEICQGRYSCDEVWARDFALTTVAKPTVSQLSMLMMVSESTKLEKKYGLANGAFRLKAGGAKFSGGYNRYAAEELIGSKLDYVVVRFDPYHLHDDVYVFDTQDRFLCKAKCIDNIAFDDTEKARQHKRAKTQMVKAVKAQAKAVERMNAIEMAAVSPELEEVAEVKPILKPLYGFDGSAALKPQAVELDDEDEQESRFAKGVQWLKATMAK
ncbi:Transposase [Bibersteinia trehalosi USDA-ARS-USMARC-189]|uniref:Transposase n=1 Tax=Bibersteinia trehalosi USDA-ARS-USMARC-189 TaxID=1263831 RepID=A0ABN4C2H6_BIBTR|nr:transposase domain-containing protein [Bibersteinia trehalosi]AGH38988.1 Transposase [Bibersteinia trehalosi USDA-ARS-USMARC-192]AHG83478.1 Transposase [Bibersteinia trehalosi USDA-ARS-USMARC-189]